MFKVKYTNMLGTSTPEAQIFVRFTLWWAVFWLWANFWKSAPNDPKWPWHVQGQKYQHACYIHPRGPNFRPFRSTMSRFWVTAQFSEKRTKWPWYVHGQKYQHACNIYRQDPNFHQFLFTISCFWVMGQFSEKCTKWPQMTLKYQHACYIHPWGPNFRPFHSTMSRFWVTAQFSEKCTEWPQMTLTCSRSKIPTCMLHTPLRPKFSPFSLYDEPFLSYGRNFRKSVPNNTTWLWHVQGQKYQYACNIHPPRSISLYGEPFV